MFKTVLYTRTYTIYVKTRSVVPILYNNNIFTFVYNVIILAKRGYLAIYYYYLLLLLLLINGASVLA